VILAYVLREPDKAKTASNKIFGEYYNWVFDESILSAENIVSLWKIYKMVDSDRRRALSEASIVSKKSYDESWIIEGVFHVLYMLSMKIESEGDDIFDAEAAFKKYHSVKDNIDEFMRQNSGVAAYRIFRSAKTKKLLVRFSKGMQLDLFPLASD
jgi:hypothetical protein